MTLLGTLSSLEDVEKRARPAVETLSYPSEEARDHVLWQKVISARLFSSENYLQRLQHF